MRPILIIIICLILGGAIWIFWGNQISENNQKKDMEKNISLEIQGIKIEAEIAKTSLEKAKGLSGHVSMASNQGMIFVYDEENKLSFWMKDMKFPIDIIWIKDNIILDITENASREPGPEYTSYLPKQPVNRVLEVNAGFTKKHDIKIGQKIEYERAL